MKKFKSRLKFYLIGFGLGLVFMFLIFGNRACSWLPENRVKNMLAEKEIIVGDSLADLMDCQGVTNEDVYRFLNEDGDVDFSKSVTDVEPKEYLFTGKKGSDDLTITFALYEKEEYAEVIDFDFAMHNCETTLSNEHKIIVPLPNFEVVAIIEDKELRILESASCKMNCYGLNESQVMSFHRNSNVGMEESKPRQAPNPEFVMQGKMGDETYKVHYIIGESRSRVLNIWTATDSCACD